MSYTNMYNRYTDMYIEQNLPVNNLLYAQVTGTDYDINSFMITISFDQLIQIDGYKVSTDSGILIKERKYPINRVDQIITILLADDDFDDPSNQRVKDIKSTDKFIVDLYYKNYKKVIYIYLKN